MGKRQLPQLMVLGERESYMEKKIKLNYFLTPYTE